MASRPSTALLSTAAIITSLVVLPGVPASAATSHCAGQARIAVPDAQKQKLSCLTDLTTASTVATGHTNPTDWDGLNAPGTRNPSGIPGI